MGHGNAVIDDLFYFLEHVIKKEIRISVFTRTADKFQYDPW